MSEAVVQPTPNRFKELAAGFGLAGAAVVAYVLFGGYFIKDNVYPEGTVDAKLEQIIKPEAIKMAQFVVAKNREINKGILVTNPGTLDNGAYTVTLHGFTANEWVKIDAEMYPDKTGKLDPKTVNYIDMTIRDYVNDGKGYYGGPEANAQEIELVHGSDSTFTQGNWGVEDSLTPAGFNNPTLDIITRTKSPTEDATSADAQNAIQVANVFVNEATTWVSEISSPENYHNLTAPKPR